MPFLSAAMGITSETTPRGDKHGIAKACRITTHPRPLSILPTGTDEQKIDCCRHRPRLCPERTSRSSKGYPQGKAGEVRSKTAGAVPARRGGAMNPLPRTGSEPLGVPSLPTEGLVRLSTVLQFVPVSRSTWWQGVKTGRFPQPVKLGTRTTCWRASDIRRLIDPQSE